MKKSIIQTEDGSPSIFVEELKETYHSRNGAVTESDYVYIKKGMQFWIENNPDKSLKVFELGLGTGLNAYLSYVFSLENQLNCTYFSLEKFPLSDDEINALQMEASLPSPQNQHFFHRLHHLEWDQFHTHPHFNFHKQKIDFLNFSSQAQFDILYYDAFGYHAQSDLWQTDALQKSYDLLRPGGVWVSYCAKGTVRRSLQQVGFQVERLEGPPGKREMLRAIKML